MPYLNHIEENAIKQILRIKQRKILPIYEEKGIFVHYISYLKNKNKLFTFISTFETSESKVRMTSFLPHHSMAAVWFITDYTFVSHNMLKWVRSEIPLSLRFLVFVTRGQIIHITFMQFCLA